MQKLRMILQFLLSICILTVACAHTCPPCDCFNCNDPGTPCLNGGICNVDSGRCSSCPTGFSGGDCKTVLCGGLPAIDRPVLDGGKACDCQKGWGGINCNLCESNSGCEGMFRKGANATCYKGSVMQKQAFKSCGAILPAFYRRLLGNKHANATSECFKTPEGFLDCRLQFWVDYTEQFWCNLKGCVEGRRDQNSTAYGCAKASCSCIEGTKLCANIPRGLINLQPMLAKVVGPASFECDFGGGCTFKEKLLNDYFAGGIQLQCQQSECILAKDHPIEPVPSDWSIIFIIIIATIVISLGLIGAFYFVTQPEPLLLSNPEEETRILMESHVPATVAFKNISYRLSNESEWLLTGVSGTVNPGEVMAIIGGSGAGKTTCIDIVAQKLKRGIISGDVMVNSNRIRPGDMAVMSGFVDQETKLFGTLTVEEILTYSAFLRLPRTMTPDAKKLRVKQTMSELAIEHLAQVRIGTSGRRGLSGGEQRRVAIACELVTSPRILFLDEPTSGLDAHSAFTVVEAIVRMARLHNRTIIMTIHQPRSNIFNLFDRLLLLASGRMVYSGPAEDAASHFATLGYTVPSGFNTADYLIDITMDANIEFSQGQLCQQFGDNSYTADEENPDSDETTRLILEQQMPATYNITNFFTFFQSSVTRSRPNTELTKRIAYLEDEFSRSESGQNLINTLPIPSGLTENLITAEKATLLDQFHILTERHFKNMSRDPLLIIPSYVLTIALALLTSLLFNPLTEDMAGVQNRLGALFFQCAYFAFAGMAVVEGWGGGGVERAVFIRERAGMCYSLAMYYMSRTLLEMILLRLFPPLLYTMITYFWIGFYPTMAAFMRHICATILFTMSTSSILQLITMLTSSNSLASLLSTLFLLFSLLFGGFLLNKERIPGLFSILPRLSPFNYAFEALIVNELREISVKDDSVVDVEIPGRIILKQFGFDADGYKGDIMALVMIFIIGMFLGFVALKALVKERR